MFKVVYPGADVEKILGKMQMKPLSEYKGESVQKMDVTFFNKEDEENFLKTLDLSLKALPSGDYNKAKFKMYGDELIPVDTSKANGVRKVLELLGCEEATTYAFGDSYNDLDMMNACDVSVVMGNGDEPVKEKADHVTDTVDNDGVYKALKFYELI